MDDDGKGLNGKAKGGERANKDTRQRITCS
jgi:hypothetical protein